MQIYEIKNDLAKIIFNRRVKTHPTGVNLQLADNGFLKFTYGSSLFHYQFSYSGAGVGGDADEVGARRQLADVKLET